MKLPRTILVIREPAQSTSLFSLAGEAPAL